MAQACPCGCGRNVKFGKSGAAKGVVRADAMIVVAKPAVDAIRQSNALASRDMAEVERSLANLERTRLQLLDHVHGEARPGTTPDLLALHRTLNSMQEWTLALMDGVAELGDPEGRAAVERAVDGYH